jgi:hypothetical protein
MLPFLKPKSQNAVIMAKYSPKDGVEAEKEEGGMDPGLLSAAEDMLSAIAMKDATALAKAFQDAFEMSELKPHEEGEHEELGEME